MQDKTDKSKPILIVEDSMPDYLTVVRVFRKLGYDNAIYHCESGQEALDYLHHSGEYENEAEAPRPVVILLDLNMPGTDGREVLKHIKTDENLKSIPVVIFIFYVLASLELIAEEIEDPFGLDANDLPLDRLAAMIRANVDELLA